MRNHGDFRLNDVRRELKLAAHSNLVDRKIDAMRFAKAEKSHGGNAFEECTDGWLSFPDASKRSIADCASVSNT